MKKYKAGLLFLIGMMAIMSLIFMTSCAPESVCKSKHAARAKQIKKAMRTKATPLYFQRTNTQARRR
jgi:hypothetical protein